VINFWLAVRFFSFFFTWGVFLPYWTVWLVQSKHFSVEEAGILVGTGLAVRAVSCVYVFPYLCRKISIYLLTWLIPLISTVIVIFFIPIHSFEGMMVIMVVFSVFYPVLLPMNETISSLLSREHSVKYGSVRSWGSVGFIVSLLIVGVLTQSFGDDAIIFIMIAGCMFIFLSSVYSTPASLKKKMKKERKSFSHLVKSPKFVWVLLICILLQGSHAAYYSYGAIYLEDLNIDKIFVNVILMIAVLAEIVFFALSNRLFKKSAIFFMFIVASLASTVRWALVFLFDSSSVFIATQLLHAFSFGLAHYAFIRYVNEEIREDLVPLAQGMYAALAMSLSTGVLTLLSGYLYAVNPQLPFLYMAVMTTGSLLISTALMFQRNSKKTVNKGGMTSGF
jgi:MFS transporter, PPP family, 3-phenylpropionic acid transporter